MAYIRLLGVFVAFVFITFAPVVSFAYDRSVHEAITQIILESYNSHNGNIFDPGDSSSIIRGSSAEDNDWRFLNHFYDPINYRGLTVLGIALGAPSEEWAQDTRGQAGWRCIAYLPCSHNLGYNDKLFSSTSDYSWDRNIYEYVYGDKQRGLEGLGHILHFIEDATVPAHVRNDQHGHIGAVGDSDPYETYTSSFTAGDVSVLSAANIPAYNNLNAYFDHVAHFTSTNFLTKDTVFTSYRLPLKDESVIKNGFLYSAAGVRIAEITTDTDRFGKRSERISVDDPQHLVLSDNWKILSQTAVLNGIGVVDLFFKKVEEERRTGAIRAKNVSAADENMKQLASKGFGLVKALYGSSLQQSDVDELLNDGGGSQSGAAALALQKQNEPPAAPPVVQKSTKPMETSNTAPIVETANEAAPPEEPLQTTTIQTPQKTEIIPETKPFVQPWVITPGYGGGGGGPVSSNATVEDVPEPVTTALDITSPLDTVVFGTTSVTFVGTSANAATVVAQYGSSTTTSTIDRDGNWTVQIDLPEGTTPIVFTATDSTGTNIATLSRDISIDLTPTDAASITVPACAYSLIATGCLVATSSVSVSWGDVSGADHYALAVNGLIDSNTTATSSVATLTFGATTSIAVVSYDVAGNAATSSSVFVEALEHPLIINEIGWGGTDSSAADQWIEIKNTSSVDIDLSHVSLRISGGSDVQLSGSIPAGQYLVLLSHLFNMRAQTLVVPFVLSSSTAQQLRLAWTVGDEQTVLDATPVQEACLTWCAGELSSARGRSEGSAVPRSFPLSMERIATDGALPGSWRSTDTYGSAMWGTPGGANSLGLPMMGIYCGSSGVLTGTDVPYNPGSGSCTFLSRQIPPLNNGNANRFGALYRGDVGSSTALMNNGQPLFGAAVDVSINFQTFNPQLGEHFFYALWEKRTGPAFDFEGAVFTLFFTTSKLPGTEVPNEPHSNYLVMPFTYAP